MNERLRDWSGYKRGFLAKAGGLHDQDADWIEDMLTLDALYSEELEVLIRANEGRRH